jgi:hypothetical protein
MVAGACVLDVFSEAMTDLASALSSTSWMSCSKLFKAIAA